MSARRAAIRRACTQGGIPRYAADLVTVRGRCRHGRCKGRWAVIRLSLDFTGERVDRLATTECTTCGRTWRRVKVPALRSAAGYQTVRLTLLLPGGTLNRWHARGRWHRTGIDGVEVRDADLGDLDEAARAHTKRADRLIDLRTARRARIEREGREATERLNAVLEAAAIRRAERDAAEAEAAARELAYA